MRDKLYIPEGSRYTEHTKVALAMNPLIGKRHVAHGLSSDDGEIGDDVIQSLIRFYTREAGVRNLEREIASICRGVARVKPWPMAVMRVSPSCHGS